MAIWVNSLSPAKNAPSVAVDSEVFIDIEGDYNLDVQSVRFFINGTEVKPSSKYSIQTGLLNRKRIEVTFFPRRRIKYVNERYGAGDTRYGKLDIFPSNFWYGSLYACRIEITDVEGNVFSDSFSFTIEDGTFFSQDIDRYYYSTNTQGLANYMPTWAKGRYDKYSNFQQILNPAGLVLEDIDKKIQGDLSNYFLQTANYNELSLLHQVKVGGDFEFKTVILDDGTSLNVPPEAVAKSGITNFYPMAEFTNSVKDFYYTKLADRIDETKVSLESNIIKAKSPAQFNKEPVSKKLERFGTVCINIEDGKSFAELDNTGSELSILVCRITGLSIHKQKQVEELSIIDNDNYFTKKRWRQIDSIQFINIPNGSDVNYTLQYFEEPGSYKSDAFRHTDADGTTKPAYWSLTSNDYGTVLTEHVLLKEAVDDVIATLGQKTEVQEYELMDVDGQTHLDLRDIASDRFSNLLYGVDDEYLYVFDKREEYPTIVQDLPKNTGETQFVIDVFADELARQGASKVVELAGIQLVVGKQVNRYVFSMRKPDGTELYIKEDGTTTTDQAEATVYVPTDEFQVKTKPITLDLVDVGDYLMRISVQYLDGSSDIDAKIVRIKTKAALVKYKMYRLLFGSPVKNIIHDYDGDIKVYDEAGYLHSLRLVKDNMLIDYENGQVFFNEGYDEVNINA